jgi:hypothetical protein
MKRFDRVMLVVATGFLAGALLWPAARDLLVLQVRLIANCPPPHPQWASPWCRPNTCMVPVEPKFEITDSDYDWLAAQNPQDWGMCVVVATSDVPYAALPERHPRRERMALQATRIAPDQPLAWITLVAVRLDPVYSAKLKAKNWLDAPTQLLPPEGATPILEAISAGEQTAPGNAYWPAMRMTVAWARGDPERAARELHAAAQSPRLDYYGAGCLDANRRAIAAMGMPRVLVEAFNLPSGEAGFPPRNCSLARSVCTGLEHRAISLEQAGHFAQADAIYADILRLSCLVTTDGPPWGIVNGAARRLAEARATALLHVRIRDDPPIFPTDHNGAWAMEQFVASLAARGRDDIVQLARQSGAISAWIAAAWPRPLHLGDLVEVVFFLAQGAWWGQVFLIPFSLLMLVVGGGCVALRSVADSGRLTAWRVGTIGATLVLLYGVWVIGWGLSAPEYGLVLPRPPDRTTSLADAVHTDPVTWLMPLLAAVAVGLYARRRSAEQAARGMRFVTRAAVRVAVLGISFVGFASVFVAAAYLWTPGLAGL